MTIWMGQIPNRKVDSVASSQLPSLMFQPSAGRGTIADSAVVEGVLSRRIGAYLVDACIIVGINVAAHTLLVILGLLTFGLAWLLLGPVTFLTVALAYDTLTIGGGRGATPGMRLFNLEARGVHGQRPDYWQAFLMTALFYATVPITSFLILLVALFTERNRTLHDILSGITVIRGSR
jgi:uncharacterized RDD family membrane protein YckC